MAKYTIAVVGCGRISQTHLKGFYESIEGVYVKYACDLIKEKADAAKEKYDFIENAVSDYKEILADKASLEAQMKKGAEEASYYARRTLGKVQKKLGFVKI